VSNLAPDTVRAFARIHEADSIVVDPHKHGLQPYGCGCILFRDPSVGGFYKHDSPYTYFTSNELHLGEISLECSRAGAAATALWATQKLLPLTPDGQFANGLACGRMAALRVYERLKQDTRLLTGPEPELDILVWTVKARTLEESSRLATAVFDLAAEQDLHLALAQVPIGFFGAGVWPGAPSGSRVNCLRSVLMKPEHLNWVDAIWSRLSQAAARAI
jgi:tyrosine decarboxylase/aspartate 1-decarboxylase